MFLDVLYCIISIVCNEIYYFWEDFYLLHGTFSVCLFFFFSFLVACFKTLAAILSPSYLSSLYVRKPTNNPRASDNNKNIYIFIEDWISGLLTLIFHLYAQGKVYG